MKILFILFTCGMLAACATSDDSAGVPDYALMIDSSGYRVRCTAPGVREIYVRHDARDTFFHPDGSEKTQEEFCAESAYGSRVR